MEEQFIYLNKIKELTVKNQDLENQIRNLEKRIIAKDKLIQIHQTAPCKCQIKTWLQLKNGKKENL